MTPEQIRIAMAEVDGWKWQLTDGSPIKANDFYWEKEGICCYQQLPNYPEDLNAVHEVEKKLFLDYQDLIQSWYNNIVLICGNNGAAMRATALQRCEAILRTLGKWI